MIENPLRFRTLNTVYPSFKLCGNNMTEQELLRLIAKNRSTESEILEFKERRESIPTGKEGSTKRSIYGYCVGIGNEGGGKLLIGISDKGAIV